MKFRYQKSTLLLGEYHAKDLAPLASEKAQILAILYGVIFAIWWLKIRPAYVIIENVEGMLVMQGGKVRDSVIASFADIGYHMKCRLLKAADYGVPQLRKRAFFVGWLDGLLPPEFPLPSSHSYVNVADAISDLPPLNAGEICKNYQIMPQTDYQIARRKLPIYCYITRQQIIHKS